MAREARKAIDSKGNEISPFEGVVPILKVTGSNLQIIGTAFYLTTYGVFATAAHVLKSLVDERGKLGEAYVLHKGTYPHLFFRQIVSVCLDSHTDAAVGQAQNFATEVPENPLKNRVCPISLETPSIGDELVTFSYPRNVIAWTPEGGDLGINCDFFDGKVSAWIDDAEATRRDAENEYYNQFLRKPFLETTVAMEGGASGAPMFCSQKVVGIFSSGLGHLPPSYAAPIVHFLGLTVNLKYVTSQWVEFEAIPVLQRGGRASVRDLIAWSHIHTSI